MRIMASAYKKGDKMIDPFEHPPLYEIEQVVTLHDLVAIRSGYVWQYIHTNYFNFWKRFKFLVGIGTIDALIDYLQRGKKGKEIFE